MAKATKSAKAAEQAKKPALSAMDAYGIDKVCGAIGEGKPMTAIAEQVGVSIGSLLVWIEADSERSARAREARTAMARYWDEKAEQGIEHAEDEFALKKAKELSHHYRWRASKIAPKEYGDKLQTEHSGAVTITRAVFPSE